MRKGMVSRTGLAIFAVLLLLAALVPLVARVEGATKTVTIATYNSIRYKQLQETIVPMIEKKHPGISVKVETYPNYWTKLYTLAGDKLAPDLFDTAGTYTFDFILSDVVVNLDPYVKRDIKLEDYFAPPWRECRYPYYTGSYYSVPYIWVTSLLYYNKDMFDVGGLNYPDESWDWNKLIQVAMKLTKDTNGDGKFDQWGFWSFIGNTLYDPLVYSYGGRVLNETRTKADLDNTGAKDALQLLVDMIHKYRISPPPGAPVNFQNRGFAMIVGGSWDMSYTYRNIDSFDWDVALVPKGPHSRTIYGGTNAWAVMRRPGQDMEAVWTVLKELISEDGLSLFLGGWAPVLKSAAANPRWLEANLRPQHKGLVMIETTKYMRDADFSPRWSQWQTARNNELLRSLRGERSVEASIKAAEAAINSILRDVKPAK